MATTPRLFRMAPLQRLRVKPIEDPAEQAAIEERLRHGEEAILTAGEDGLSAQRRAALPSRTPAEANANSTQRSRSQRSTRKRRR
jgi:hypothetical protein